MAYEIVQLLSVDRKPTWEVGAFKMETAHVSEETMGERPGAGRQLVKFLAHS